MLSDWQAYEVAEDHSNQTHCNCCASLSHTITGDIYLGEEYKAYYSVRWTDKHKENGATFAVFCGDWGDDGQEDERFLIGLDFITGENGGFGLHENPSETLSHYADMNPVFLKRDDILGSEFASELFAYVDAVFMKDPRLDVLREWSNNA